MGFVTGYISLLENACHELDLLQAEKDTGAGDTRAGTSFGQYSAALRRLSEVQTLHRVTEQVCRDGDQLLMHLALSIPDPESNPQLRSCQEWIVEQRSKAESLVIENLWFIHVHTPVPIQGKEFEELKRVVSKKFSLKNGPFILGLENALQELNVQRQAYQGGDFCGKPRTPPSGYTMTIYLE